MADRWGLAGVASVSMALLAIGCSQTAAQSTPGAGGRRGGRGAAAGGAQPVVTAKVAQKDVPVDIAAVGSVETYTSISLRSQVTGQLQQAFFHEGDLVKTGDRLFIIEHPL